MNLSFDRFLALVGVIIGLPGFLILIFSQQVAIGILVFIILLGIGWFYYHENFTGSFNIIHSRKKLELLDRDGKKATVTLERKIKPNFKGIREFIFTNIRSDGEITNFRSNFGKLTLVEKEAGAFLVHVGFPKELKKGVPVDVILSYDILDGYPNRTENTMLIIDFLTKSLEFDVYFPEGRPCLDSEVYKISGADKRELCKPDCSPDHLHLTWKIHRFLGLSRGSHYKLEWTW